MICNYDDFMIIVQISFSVYILRCIILIKFNRSSKIEVSITIAIIKYNL